jgi:hypothetical protein
MKQFDKRLLAVSFLLHIFIFFFVTFVGSDTNIRKTFLAYGRHSRYMTHAYFRRMQSKGGSYKKYLQKRRLAYKKAIEQRRLKRLARRKKLAKKQAARKKSPKKVAKKLSKPKPVPKKEIPKEVEEQLEMLHFNMMGETDPKMVMYQQHIQEEVDRLWRPPIGVPKGAECLVQFTVDKCGKVKHFEIIKGSNIVIYDLSIVRVAKKFTFHKCLWGKSFPINFRQ